MGHPTHLEGNPKGTIACRESRGRPKVCAPPPGEARASMVRAILPEPQTPGMQKSIGRYHTWTPTPMYTATNRGAF